MSDWSWILQLLSVVVYGLINHTLLSLVTKFIYSKPPGQRMVCNKSSIGVTYLASYKTKFGKLEGGRGGEKVLKLVSLEVWEFFQPRGRGLAHKFCCHNKSQQGQIMPGQMLPCCSCSHKTNYNIFCMDKGPKFLHPFSNYLAGVDTFVQGTVVQGPLCPREISPRRLLSKETLVQGDHCPK